MIRWKHAMRVGLRGYIRTRLSGLLEYQLPIRSWNSSNPRIEQDRLHLFPIWSINDQPFVRFRSQQTSKGHACPSPVAPANFRTIWSSNPRYYHTPKYVSLPPPPIFLQNHKLRTRTNAFYNTNIPTPAIIGPLSSPPNSPVKQRTSPSITEELKPSFQNMGKSP